MKIIIMHQTVVNYDAIGNDIECMYKILKKDNFCKVFAQNRLNSLVEYIEEDELLELIQSASLIIIYHHSVYWLHGEEILEKNKGRLIIRYHNITPPEFFQPYNVSQYQQCSLGREQTQRYLNKFKKAYWLLDSEYNSTDILLDNKKRIAVCPPFNLIEQWAEKKPVEKILKSLIFDECINLLFVGRIAPNKGHLKLIEVVNCYCNVFGTDIKLRIIGKLDENIAGYNDEIMEAIKKYGIEDNIEFIGEIDDSKLISYYIGSDFFLCTSEHEGFCVPLVEAQHFGLPIICINSTAIPETIGSNQLVLKDSAKELAAAINILYGNEKYYKFLRDNGQKNYSERFTFTEIRKRFMEIMIHEFEIFNK